LKLYPELSRDQRRLLKAARKGLLSAARLANRLEIPLKLAEALINAQTMRKGGVGYSMPGGWVQCNSFSACTIPPTHKVTAAINECFTLGSSCLGGQSSGGLTILKKEDPIPFDHRRVAFVSDPALDQFQRIGYRRLFVRNSLAADTVGPSFGTLPGSPVSEDGLFSGAMRDPNLARYANLTPQPLVIPAPATDRQTDRTLGSERRGVTSPAQASRTLVVTSTPTKPGSGFAGPPTRPPHASKVPPKHSKQVKGSITEKLGHRVARYLDNLSEGSEAVEGIYEALPQEVRDRWDCGKKLKALQKGAAFGGQGGQYGLNVTDCHLKAIFHNAHLIDPVLAAKNLAANQIEDALIGASMQSRDKILRRGKLRNRKFAL
jgi:hypothetical protein